MSKSNPMSKLSFSEHPAAVGETYFEHMGVATGFGVRMIAGGLACLVHGLLPFAFTSTGSRTIVRLHDRMVANRTRAAQHRSEAGSAVSA
ncbi:capsule biosynthesis protein [Methylobacterium indicum]|uniref:DUF6356 family protein n=1 Tax=Methylobacterium indicum TaxID=1775910 RepID=UPI000652E3DC|nr:DUF6356 family protein [Methylobacterium indicum]KTS25664.1 capsule biosynthesis protein [Methylobacterium indicum]KTS30438.1 capsule biosynthesis protein [Methylobacterium indicum]KTS43253.1 capsule biosynthesis protein [Methylobacterium indicum]